ncbi:hypothetical protein DPSP01_010501 [Paraphaeosphaeria sporulosa]
MLCHSCEGSLQRLDLSLAQEVELHAGFDSLITSSISGCQFCRMIASDLYRQEVTDKIRGDYRVIANSIANKGFIVAFRPPIPVTDGSKSVDVDVKVVVEDLRVPAGISKVLQTLECSQDTHTGSLNAFKLASAWLTECNTYHPRCNNSNALSTQLPTRVIDVGSLQTDETTIRLLETGGQKTGSYAALSHCWGGSSHVCSTLSTLPIYTSKIEMSILPKTFADAVRATQQLGIRYLWIDSLCIVQDSASDWETEAAKMGSYYTSALVTISAAHGANSDAGLFVNRDALSMQPCSIEIKHGDHQRQAYAYVRDTSFQLSRSSLGELRTPLPLYTRSWVLQEQILAPRTLTYGHFGVSWRCQTMRFDERAPLSMPIEDFIKDKPGGFATFRGDPRDVETTVAELQRNWIFPRQAGDKHGLQTFHKHVHCDPASDHFAQDWGRLVQNYTSRGMTRQTDKLIAIAGVASIAAALKAIEYSAGVWNGSHDMLIQGLLWSASKRGARLFDVAPSWSWASIECEVNWPGHLSVAFRRTASVLSFACSGTAARCKGSITLQSRGRRGVINSDGGPRLIADQQGDASLPDTIAPHWKQGVITLDEIMRSPTPLLFLEVATGKVNYTRTDSLVHTLVLVCDDESPGKYRRVGFATWDDSFWDRPTATASQQSQMQVTIH